MAGNGDGHWGRALAAVLARGAALRVAAVLTVGDVPELHGDENHHVEFAPKG